MLIIHGAPGGYDQSLLAAEKWTLGGFSVLVCSRPGYLRTPLGAGFTIEEQADAIASLLDTLGIHKVAILGASAGGTVALQFALSHPDRIWALVVVAGVSWHYSLRQNQRSSFARRIILSDSIMDIGVWFYDLLTRYWPSMSLKQLFNENVALQPEEIDDYVRRVMRIPEQVAWFKNFVRTACPLSLRKKGLARDLKLLTQISMRKLDDIHCPTLVVHGTADRDVPFSNAKYTARSIPNAILYNLENVGHIVWLGEHAKQMDSDILEFLKTHCVKSKICPQH